MQNLECPAHCVMQAGMDRIEHNHSLLDQSQGGADRHTVGIIGKAFKCCLNNALCLLGQNAHKCQKGLRRAGERKGHKGFPNVVIIRSAFNFHNLRRLQVK